MIYSSLTVFAQTTLMLLVIFQSYIYEDFKYGCSAEKNANTMVQTVIVKHYVMCFYHAVN